METKLTLLNRRLAAAVPMPDSGSDIAAAYNQAGDGYIAYADGDPEKLFAFNGNYNYGDRQIWKLIDTKLHTHFISGANTLRILDLGCGPGTWLRRIVTRASDLGFRHIIARGFDIA
jgi:SAM-dependent methyltransferase